MIACDDCFEEFLHPLVHEAMDKNERFRGLYGVFDRWDWDGENILTFSNEGVAKLRIEVSVVGTSEGNSWEWSWANPNFGPHSKRDIEKIKEFGQANGYDKLTSRFLASDEYTGWEMTAIAVHVLNAPGSYRFPTETGFCYLVYRKIEEIEQEDAIHRRPQMAMNRPKKLARKLRTG